MCGVVRECRCVREGGDVNMINVPWCSRVRGVTEQRLLWKRYLVLFICWLQSSAVQSWVVTSSEELV